jgi:acyl dehydratase
LRQPFDLLEKTIATAQTKKATEPTFDGLNEIWLTFAVRNALCNQLPARPVLIAGLGLEKMDLAMPARPGDRLSIRVSVVDTRRSKSKPDTGIVTLRQTVENQQGEAVLSMTSKMIVRARSETE